MRVRNLVCCNTTNNCIPYATHSALCGVSSSFWAEHCGNIILRMPILICVLRSTALRIMLHNVSHALMWWHVVIVVVVNYDHLFYKYSIPPLR